MNLNFRKIGEGEPVLMTHGVFGSGDNLVTASKAIAQKGYQVFLMDARNHGRSPHTSSISYPEMASDLDTFLTAQGLKEPVVVGHSMGGKTVLEFSQHYENFSKMVVIDIAPKAYEPHHQHILAGIHAINLESIQSRKQAEDILGEYVADLGERQFILKNIYRTESGFKWRINVNAISNHIESIGAAIELKKVIDKPSLFITGSESNYVATSDQKEIRSYYKDSHIVDIKGANHWVHASKPKEFVATMLKFLML